MHYDIVSLCSITLKCVRCTYNAIAEKLKMGRVVTKVDVKSNSAYIFKNSLNIG